MFSSSNLRKTTIVPYYICAVVFFPGLMLFAFMDDILYVPIVWRREGLISPTASGFLKKSIGSRSFYSALCILGACALIPISPLLSIYVIASYFVFLMGGFVYENDRLLSLTNKDNGNALRIYVVSMGFEQELYILESCQDSGRRFIAASCHERFGPRIYILGVSDEWLDCLFTASVDMLSSLGRDDSTSRRVVVRLHLWSTTYPITEVLGYYDGQFTHDDIRSSIVKLESKFDLIGDTDVIRAIGTRMQDTL